MNQPYSAAADRNKQAIGDALASTFANITTVLEVGSGTGQHAIYLCDRFKHLQWQPTEQQEHLESLSKAIQSTGLANISKPVELAMQATQSRQTDALPGTPYTLAYSANTAHIMSIEEVAIMFQVVARKITAGALFVLYGPFKIKGQHTSEGNAQFDAALRMEQPHMGIRDKGELEVIANACELTLHKDIPMPANNRILMWRKS